MNPDIELESEVNGVSGDHGAKASTTCADVYCFPTMCTGELTPATTTNGQCCPKC